MEEKTLNKPSKVPQYSFSDTLDKQKAELSDNYLNEAICGIQR